MDQQELFLFDRYGTDGVPRRLFSIGRDSGCTIRLTHPTVSRSHAVIERRPPGYWITDHISTNRIYIDGVCRNEPTLLTPGMEIYLGDTLLIVTDETGRLLISADSLSNFCRQAQRIYGGSRPAARALKTGREQIRGRAMSEQLRRNSRRKK